MKPNSDIKFQRLMVSLGKAEEAKLPFPTVLRPTVFDLILLGIFVWHALTLHTFKGWSMVFFIAVLIRLMGRIGTYWDLKKKFKLPGAINYYSYFIGTNLSFIFAFYECWILWPR